MSNTAEIFGLFPTPVMVRQYIGDLTLITNFL